jgi:2-iminoacetate synthase ThiH
MTPIDEVFRLLSVSAFRRKFRLQGRELAYLQTWGLPHVMKQAEEILRKRVAPAVIANDGRQTPWRNHPVFVAQHATATCCRGCLEKTHGIAKGHALTDEEMAHALAVIERWLGPFR